MLRTSPHNMIMHDMSMATSRQAHKTISREAMYVYASLQVQPVPDQKHIRHLDHRYTTQGDLRPPSVPLEPILATRRSGGKFHVKRAETRSAASGCDTGLCLKGYGVVFRCRVYRQLFIDASCRGSLLSCKRMSMLGGAARVQPG